MIKKIFQTSFVGIFILAFLFVSGKLFFEDQLDFAISKIKNLWPSRPVFNELTIGVGTELTSLSPLNTETQNLERLFQMYEGLVRMDRDLQIAPALAINYGSIDDTKWEFRLRPNIKFHSGDILTVDDVLHSLAKANLSTIDSTEKISGDRFSITTKKTDPLLLQKLASVLIFPRTSGDPADMKPNGTGPYQFENFENGVLKLRLFGGYWDEAPFFDSVKLLTLQRRDERKKILETDTIDIVTDVPPEIVPEFYSEKTELVTHPTLEVNVLLFGLRGTFARKDFRKAALMSFDRNDVAKLAFGFAKPLSQFTGKGIFGYDPSIEPAKSDPQAAADIVEGAVGEDFPEIEIDLPKGFQALGEYLGEKLRKAGFAGTVSYLDDEALQEKILSGTSDIYFFGWRYELGDVSTFFHDVVHSRKGKYGKFNGAGYAREKADRLIEESEAILSPLERLEKLREVMKIVTEEDIIGIPLFSPEALYAVKKGISWKPRMDGYVLAAEITK